jgi:hypothetical protein
MVNTPNNFLYPLQWYLEKINAKQAWDLLNDYGSDDIVVAIIDNGLQSQTINGVPTVINENLNGSTVNNLPKIVKLFDLQTNAFNNDRPLNEHGTAVASLIASKVGPNGIVGVSPNTRLISITQSYNNLEVSGYQTVFNWMLGLEKTFDDNSYLQNNDRVKIINRSINGIPKSKITTNKLQYDDWIEILNRATTIGRDGLGVIIVSAAGNGKVNADGKSYTPISVEDEDILSTYKCICVGASTINNIGDEVKASYSNYSNYLDVVAPGGSKYYAAPDVSFEPPNSYSIVAASTKNGGNIPGDNSFNLILQNSITLTPNHYIDDYELFVNDITGLFPGQSILIHKPNFSPNADDVDARIIKNIIPVSPSPKGKIIVEGLNYPHSNGDIITIASSSKSKLTSVVSPGDTELVLDNVIGLYRGQQLIIKNNVTGSHETINIKSTIDGIDYSQNKIKLATNIAGTYPVNSNLIPSSNKNAIVNNVTLVTDQNPPLTLDKTKVDKLVVTDSFKYLKGEKIGIIKTPPFSGTLQSKYQEAHLLEIDESNNLLYVFDAKGANINKSLILNTQSEFWGRTGDYTIDFFATSAAAPIVSGVAALILAANPNLNWLEVREIIRITADRIDSSNLAYPYNVTTTSRDISNSTNLTKSTGYGFGRVNALAAVNYAKNTYSVSQRDIMIRDNIYDLGSSPSLGLIDSPDVWVRNLPDPSYVSPTPADYGTPGPHKNPTLNSSVAKKIFVRLKNIGSLPSLEGAEVKCFIAFTNQTNPTFPFPDFWQENINSPTGENVILVGKKEIPIINNGFEEIIDVDWDLTKQLPNPQNLKSYLLVHITPFDRGVTANIVSDNNNLTYKPIIFSAVNFKSGSGTGSLQKIVPVDSGGTTETLPFKIELQNTDTALANNIEIKATINYRNATPSETVIFKYNGSGWVFTTYPAPGNPSWISLNAPTLSGSSANGIQEFTNFSGILSLNNTALKITLEAEQFDASANSVLQSEYNLNVTFNYPVPESGVASEKKTSIYTFADFDQLPAQSGTNNFGPVTSALTTEYRTWSSFTGIQSGTNLKAYAVTNGEFFIQEVTGNPNVINLILKPDNQPDNKIGLVKYYVYRGIKKGSFLDGAGQVLPSSTTNLSALLTRMWVVRDTLNTEAGLTETIKRNDLGLDEGTSTLPATMLIEDVFDTYVFQKLSPGMSIGEFETSGDYGFQIIVEGPNYKPTLADMRVLDHKVIITYQSGQPQFGNGAEEDIKTKLDREQILSFVDPVAYFGLMAFDKVLVNKSSGVLTISNDAVQVKTEILDKFATSNQIYIDIRNDLNNSLNFYGSYSDAAPATKVAKIKFKNSSGTFVDKEYHTNGWPILTIPVTDITASTADIAKITLQLPQGDNDFPGLFLSGASFFSDGLKYKEKFKILNTSSSLTDDFELSLANISSTSTVLPFILKLSFTRRYDIDNLQTIPATLTRPWKDDYIDNLLSLNDVNITPPVNDATFQNTVKWDTNSELKYIGWTSLKGFDFVSRNGLAKDKLGVVLFCYLSSKSEFNNTQSLTKINSELNLEKNAKNSISFFLAAREELKYLSLYQREINLNSGNLDIIQVNANADNLSVDILDKSAENLISVAIESTEFSSLTLCLNNYLTNSTIGLILFNHTLKNDLNDVAFFEAELGIQYCSYDNTNFSHVILRENRGLKLYSVDGKNYFTVSYINNLKNYIPKIIA